MTRREVASAKNPIVQRFRDAAAGKVEGVLLAEGVRLVAEALDAGLAVVDAAASPRCGDRALVDRLADTAAAFYDCTDDVLARMSQLETSPGVAALVRVPRFADDELLRPAVGGSPLVVVAAGVRDPGNLGSVVRTAEAAGASSVLAMAGGADPFRDKAVRGSMGSVFRLPVRHGLDAAAVAAFAAAHRLQLVVADGAGEVAHTAADLRQPTLLVVGAEAAGVPEALRRAAALRVRIPIHPPVESLNVAVACGVLLFEAHRQRAAAR
ncbi:MAG: RNA methyltransferase [Planctomycetota bacterium]